MKYQDIKLILKEQREEFLAKETGTTRKKLFEIERYLKNNLAVVISGLRRVGKSTLLRQIAKEYFHDKDFFYINFEDERLIDFRAENFNKFLEVLIELNGEQKVFLIDEVQNVKSWELFTRRLIDNNYKFFITGSNSELLSKELGSRLTGRYIETSLLPFSFFEYLEFYEVKNLKLSDTLTTKQTAEIIKRFDLYLSEGGIPAVLKIKDSSFNQTLYENIIYKDVIARYRIESESSIKSVSSFLANNIACLIAFNKLKQNLHLGNITTVKNYVSYLENAWLYFTVNIFDPSIKRQQIAPKKVYAIDTGFIKNIALQISEKHGQLLENFVFLDLKRFFKDIYYYKTKNNLEVDFFVPDKRLLVQSSYDLSDKETYNREVNSLQHAMKELRIKKSFIVTLNQEEELRLNKTKIVIIPAYKFFYYLEDLTKGKYKK